MSDANRDARLAADMRDMEGMVSDALGAMRVLELVVRDVQRQCVTDKTRGSGFVTLHLNEDQAAALDYAPIHAGNVARALHARFNKALEAADAR
jgi:hypothetical protein